MTEIQEKNNDQNNVIKLTGSIFKAIAENDKIPRSIRIILSNLQSYYLELAIESPNLFAIENHQARVFLERISQAAMNWNQELDTNNLFLKKVKTTVEHILNLEQYDSSAFVKYQETIERTLSRIAKKAEIKKKRSNEKLLGQEKIELAKKNTEDLIAGKLNSQSVPDFVQSILKNEWTNVLVLLKLRHKLDSEEYISKLKFVDLLIDFSQTNPNATVTKNKILALSKKYKEGLKLVAFNPIETVNKQKQLINNLAEINKAKQAVVSSRIKDKIEPVENKTPLEITKRKTVQKTVTTPKENNTSVQNQESSNTNHQAKEEQSNTLSSIKKGMWFKFKQDDQAAIKAKLSWISPITGKFLFVDSNGLKITDKTPEELQKGIESSTIEKLN